VTFFICTTCGTQFAASAEPPARCAVCEDERQYVNADGQEWTTLDELRAGHRAVVKEEGPGLTGLGIEPSFAIGQRVLLVESPEGNVLWDCIPLVADAHVDALERAGGAIAIAISHPHFYGAMVEWSRALGDVPIYLHADDREWVMRPDERIVFWLGEALRVTDGLTLVRCGGHFAGSAVLHWADGAALLTGDTVQVVPDRGWVSFMSSYPNLIPLPAETVRRIAATLEPYEFERIYGGWFGRVVPEDGKGAVRRSAERYAAAVTPGE
jgi:glyoxylase-like metal-dependent hydrolase (beta-lactamase superfamily II)